LVLEPFLRLYEKTDTSLICLFCLFAKKTGRQLSCLSMIVEALTAPLFSWAGLVCAVTEFFKLLRDTFHIVKIP
jgi:hypothetical protein